jgi:hypothetical protein
LRATSFGVNDLTPSHYGLKLYRCGAAHLGAVHLGAAHPGRQGSARPMSEAPAAQTVGQPGL